MSESEFRFHPALTPELISEIMIGRGQEPRKVEDPTTGATALHSVSAGVSYSFFFGNQAINGAEGFADAVIQASFAIHGDMPMELVNRWNAYRRFGRLFIAEDKLYLVMDVIAYGGLSDDCARAFLEIWDQLVPEILVYLREELPRLASEAAKRNADESREENEA